MAGIHVYSEISVQGGAKFSAGGVGGNPPPTPIAGSATAPPLVDIGLLYE